MEMSTLLSLSYSEKAVDTYDSAQLEVLTGAGHGFSGEDRSGGMRPRP